MRTRFLERNLYLPALHEAFQDERRRGLWVSAQQGLGLELFERIADQHPAKRDDGHAGVVPHGRAAGDLDRPVVLAIPDRNCQRGPGGGRIGQDFAERRQPLSHHDQQ